MHFDAHEAVPRYGFFNHHSDAARITLGMNKGESVKAIWPAVDDPGHLAIGDGVVGMKSGEQHGAIDPGPGCAPPILLHRCVCVPWASKPIALSGMAVAIN